MSVDNISIEKYNKEIKHQVKIKNICISCFIISFVTLLCFMLFFLPNGTNVIVKEYSIVNIYNSSILDNKTNLNLGQEYYLDANLRLENNWINSPSKELKITIKNANVKNSEYFNIITFDDFKYNEHNKLVEGKCGLAFIKKNNNVNLKFTFLPVIPTNTEIKISFGNSIIFDFNRKVESI